MRMMCTRNDMRQISNVCFSFKNGASFELGSKWALALIQCIQRGPAFKDLNALAISVQ